MSGEGFCRDRPMLPRFHPPGRGFPLQPQAQAANQPVSCLDFKEDPVFCAGKKLLPKNVEKTFFGETTAFQGPPSFVTGELLFKGAAVPAGQSSIKKSPHGPDNLLDFDSPTHFSPTE